MPPRLMAFRLSSGAGSFHAKGVILLQLGVTAYSKGYRWLYINAFHCFFWLRDWFGAEACLVPGILNPSLLRTDELTKIIRIDHRIGREIPKKPLTVR